MRIFLTNDDGVESEGIRRIYASLKDAGHDAIIVAPTTNRSTVSRHSH